MNFKESNKNLYTGWILENRIEIYIAEEKLIKIFLTLLTKIELTKRIIKFRIYSSLILIHKNFKLE